MVGLLISLFGLLIYACFVVNDNVNAVDVPCSIFLLHFDEFLSEQLSGPIQVDEFFSLEQKLFFKQIKVAIKFAKSFFCKFFNATKLGVREIFYFFTIFM